MLEVTRGKQRGIELQESGKGKEHKRTYLELSTIMGKRSWVSQEFLKMQINDLSSQQMEGLSFTGCYLPVVKDGPK